jgi:ribosomal protein S18 acetylase RimI-like enzyme
VAGSLRSFAAADRPAVLELSRHALHRSAEQVGNPLWETREEMESELSDWDLPPSETLFVEEDDGRVAGFGGIEAATGWEHADLFGPLVGTAFRGQKIGSRLLEASVEAGRSRSVSRIIASVGTRNLTGRLLLERKGFRALGSVTEVYRLLPHGYRGFEDAPAGVEVRRGEAPDLGAALGLYHECFPGGHFPESAWLGALERGTVYLAEEAGRPIGVIDIDPSDRWTYHVGVTEAERDRGVGSYLLSQALEDYWRRHPDEPLGLSVSADNIPAIRLYRRLGFVPWLVLQPFQLVL